MENGIQNMEHKELESNKAVHIVNCTAKITSVGYTAYKYYNIQIILCNIYGTEPLKGNSLANLLL